jgi:hypothetical protein
LLSDVPANGHSDGEFYQWRAKRITSACSERALWINSFYVQDIGASVMRGVMRPPFRIATPVRSSTRRWNWFLAADFEGKWMTVNGFAEVRLDGSRFEGLLRLGADTGIYHRVVATIDDEGKGDGVVTSPETGTPPFELRGELFERTATDGSSYRTLLLTDGTTVLGLTHGPRSSESNL